jgi:hypothetical protein
MLMKVKPAPPLTYIHLPLIRYRFLLKLALSNVSGLRMAFWRHGPETVEASAIQKCK